MRTAIVLLSAMVLIGLVMPGLSLNAMGTGEVAPVVTGTATSNETVATTSHTVSLPTGIEPGEMVIVLFTIHNGALSPKPVSTFPGTFTVFASDDSGSPVSPTNISLAFRIADGTEGASITVTTDLAMFSAHHTYRIAGSGGPGFTPEASTLGLSQAVPIDPGDFQVNYTGLAPAGGGGGGPKNYLWIAGGAYNDDRLVITSGPANFGSLIQNIGGPLSGAGVGLGSAIRTLEASSEGPGNFTLDSNSPRRVGVLVAVHPVPLALPTGGFTGVFGTLGVGIATVILIAGIINLIMKEVRRPEDFILLIVGILIFFGAWTLVLSGGLAP